jgi:hypothetical protein
VAEATPMALGGGSATPRAKIFLFYFRIWPLGVAEATPWLNHGRQQPFGQPTFILFNFNILMFLFFKKKLFNILLYKFE